jgi:hypothetical protein
MTELWRDIRHGLRLLWKNPGFTSVSLIALALGIGATTAIFSLLYSVLLAPLPYALALILVGGAGLILRSFWNVTQIDIGIRRDHVLTFTVPMQDERTVTAPKIRSVHKELQERIGAVPGVKSVAMALGLPRVGGPRLHFAIVGQPSEAELDKQPETIFMPVTPGYYPTYGIRLTKGRFLDGKGGRKEKDNAETLRARRFAESLGVAGCSEPSIWEKSAPSKS